MTGAPPRVSRWELTVTELDRKALTREYKETPRPAGVFLVRNSTTGRSLLGSAPDLSGMLNRQRFQLELGSHPDSELQSDWNALGPEAFEFEVLDVLEPQEGQAANQAEELGTLVAVWREKLAESGVPLYPRSTSGT